MSETVTLTLDKEMAKTVQTIQALRDCGIIRMTDELTCMDGIWDRLSPEDKRFVAGIYGDENGALPYPESIEDLIMMTNEEVSSDE